MFRYANMTRQWTVQRHSWLWIHVLVISLIRCVVAEGHWRPAIAWMNAAEIEDVLHVGLNALIKRTRFSLCRCIALNFSSNVLSSKTSTSTLPAVILPPRLSPLKYSPSSSHPHLQSMLYSEPSTSPAHLVCFVLIKLPVSPNEHQISFSPFALPISTHPPSLSWSPSQLGAS